MTLQDIFNRLSTTVSSPQFLTGMGVTGTVTTAYFSGRASFKAAELIAREEAQLTLDGEGLSNKERVKLVWPLYVPPVSLGVTTIAAIVMANHESSRHIAALTIASGISERALIEYKNKVKEKLGDSKATQVRDAINQDRVTNNPPTSQVIMADDNEQLCYDTLTGRYFKSDMESLRKAMNDVCYEMIVHDYASLSFFYDRIGLEPTPYSDYVGWRIDDHPEMQFSAVLSPDNRPCIAIEFDVMPHPNYNNTW